ncbi:MULTISPECIES: hypothetical protein [Aurantimonas]|uniref:hypothetical protein n=1 Tax=Aurantimonas TaxID=182269 RepID=UPI0035188CBB
MVADSPLADQNKVDTLGKLADQEMGLAWYCNACNRKLGLDLDEAIRRWGRAQVFIQWSAPVKCSGCGSRDIVMIVQAKVPGR